MPAAQPSRERIPPGTTACVPPADRPQSGHGSHRTIRPAPARPGARAQTDAIHDQYGTPRSAVRRSRSRSRLHYATTLSPHHRTSAAASQERSGVRRPVAVRLARLTARTLVSTSDGARIGTTCGPSTSIMPVAVKAPDRTPMNRSSVETAHTADLLYIDAIRRLRPVALHFCNVARPVTSRALLLLPRASAKGKPRPTCARPETRLRLRESSSDLMIDRSLALARCACSPRAVRAYARPSAQGLPCGPGSADARVSWFRTADTGFPEPRYSSTGGPSGRCTARRRVRSDLFG